jgi:hypothetical protein
MAQHDDLFELIRSLTPSEKRYFKLHADKYTGSDYKSHYEKLYDALQHWPSDSYDEKEFKKKQKGKAFLKNLPTEKNYLKELLLKTLRNYHSENDRATSLHEMLLDIRLLLDKGLKNQAAKVIDRAMRIAKTAELHSQMLLLHDYLLELRRIDANIQPVSGTEIAAQERGVLEQLQLTRRAVHLQVAIIDIHMNNSWAENQKEVEKIMSETTEMLKHKQLTRRAGLYLLNIRQYYLVHLRQYEDVLSLTTEWLQKLEAKTDDNFYSEKDYRPLLANYLLSALQCEKFELMPAAIDKIKSLNVHNDRSAAESFRLAAQYELVYLLNRPEIKGADAMLQHIEQGLIRYRSFLSEQQLIRFRFNISLLFFLQRNYSTALDHINKLYHLSGRDERYQYTTGMARAMEWMCHSSCKHYTILDNSLRNLKRYFADRELTGPFFNTLFQLYSTIIKEAGMKPASRVSVKKQLTDAPLPKEWEQLRAIVLVWI